MTELIRPALYQAFHVIENISSQEIEKFSNLYRSQSNKPRFDFNLQSKTKQNKHNFE